MKQTIRPPTETVLLETNKIVEKQKAVISELVEALERIVVIDKGECEFEGLVGDCGRAAQQALAHAKGEGDV